MTAIEFQLAHASAVRFAQPPNADAAAEVVALAISTAAIAERSPGLVWAFGDDAAEWPGVGAGLIVSLSVWNDAETLASFAYESAQLAATGRREVAERLTCAWWVPADHRPSVGEAAARLAQLRESGPTPASFTVGEPYAAPAVRAAELVIFDCDGVLVDSEPATCRVMAELITEVGLPKTPEDCMREYVGQWWPDSEARIEAELGRPLPADFEATYRRRQDAALGAGVEPVAGVIDVVDQVEAAGIATCVASNGPHEKMAITLGGAGLAERFRDRVFSSADVPLGKPAPDLFLHAAHALGVEPGACRVIEDSPLGVIAARTAGIAAWGFASHADANTLAAAGGVPFGSMADLPALLGLPRHTP